MNVKIYMSGIIAGIFSTAAFAALQCSDYQCDVKWKTNMGEIDQSSVCYNFKGKSEYTECRNLAVDVFNKRCEKGKNQNNQAWVGVYCGAAKTYRP
jgi:hypothetical protein